MNENREILSVKRNEFKYLLTIDDALRLKKQIAAVLQPDEFSQNGPYRVKSLYFDSINHVDFYTKYAGVHTRKKIRLRIYDENEPYAKLELKAKEGIFQQKSSVLVSKSDALALCKGEFGVLLRHPSEEAVKLYSLLVLGAYKPAVIVEYDREAFMYSEYKTRITFDTQIKSSELDLNLYNPHLPYLPLLYDMVVVEVKFNQKLAGFLSQILKSFPMHNVSFSKYCTGRHILESYIA